MENPFYILNQYFDNITETHYYDGGASIKIKIQGENKDSYGSVTFDKKTLLTSTVEIYMKTEDDSGSIKYKYSYGKSFKRKTAQEIGYKE